MVLWPSDRWSRTTARRPFPSGVRVRGPDRAGGGDPAARPDEGEPVTDSAVGAPAGSPELVQLLTPEGERTEHPGYAYDPDPDTLRSLYRDLVLVRRVDTEATALQRQGELGIWASLL